MVARHTKGRPTRTPVGLAGLAVAVLGLFVPSSASAWIYSEHRQITARGIETLEPKQRGLLDSLWEAARQGHESRLCAAADAGDQGTKPPCIDLAAWPAIAADHSCSPQDMLQIVLESQWILKVAAVSAKVGAGLAGAHNESERRNVRTVGDLGLERADPYYSTRAAAGNAHFLLPRSGSDPEAYARKVLKPGAEPSAGALYILLHSAALELAASGAAADPAKRPEWSRLVLALEAFALHFLEDSFAAGHIAGSWGGVAERKGTHDYYNEHGLDTETWKHESILLFGDGYMTAEDLERAGRVVRSSLAEVTEALDRESAIARTAASAKVPPDVLDGTWDLCTVTRMPDWQVPESVWPYLATIVRGTPVPFRGQGAGSLPRFRAEIGPFIGIASGASIANADGGFTEGAHGGAAGSLDVGVRFGLGLEALLGDSGDGLIFLQAGYILQSRSSGGCDPNCPDDPLLGQFVPGLPSRSGLQFRLRLPFWLVPGDLLLAAPVLAFTSPDTLKKMAITAANGGLIPWQTKIATPVGRVQFMAGREVSATLYGFTGEKDPLLVPGAEGYTAVAFRSIEWDFPVIEYRPFREYGTRYTFATFLQLGLGIDQPMSVQVVSPPDAPLPPLKTRYFGFLRIFFDGRRYF